MDTKRIKCLQASDISAPFDDFLEFLQYKGIYYGVIFFSNPKEIE